MKLAAIFEHQHRIIEKHDCACFVAYCAITSNGSSDVAEIIRRVSEVSGLCPNMFEEDGPDNEEDLIDEDYGLITWDRHPASFENLYEAMFYFSNRRMFHAPGSCKQNRHTYCSRGMSIYHKFHQAANDKENIQWPVYLETHHCPIKKMLDIFETCCTCTQSNPTMFEDAFDSMKIELEESVEGVGSFNVHHVIHLAALFGLVPMKAFGYATLDVKGSNMSRKEANKKRGPVQFIQATCFNDEFPNRPIPASDVQIIFKTLFDELCQIFGKKQVQKALLENKLCEMNRMLNVYFKQWGMKKSKVNEVSFRKLCRRLMFIPNSVQIVIRVHRN